MALSRQVVSVDVKGSKQASAVKCAHRTGEEYGTGLAETPYQILCRPALGPRASVQGRKTEIPLRRGALLHGRQPTMRVIVWKDKED